MSKGGNRKDKAHSSSTRPSPLGRSTATTTTCLPISDVGATLLNNERLGSQHALNTGTYAVFRNAAKERLGRAALPDS